jgi:mono/diheme cytochrome c family protein
LKRQVALFLAALTTSGCLWVVNKSQPDSDSIARDPARVDRGRYLVESVANCFACHPRTAKLGTLNHFDKERGRIPGEVWAPNLTSDTDTGLGNWTDGLVLRAIREGVDADHEALVPVHPYLDYNTMADEDAKSVVAYLRSLKPVQVRVPGRKLEPLYSLMLNLIPKSATHSLVPDRSDKVAYGKYLATMASCGSCHQPRSGDGPKPELAFSSPNITSDPENGIGKWTDDEIRDAITKGVKRGGKVMECDMPFSGYAGMTDADLEALIAFLRTVPPAKRV